MTSYNHAVVITTGAKKPCLPATRGDNYRLLFIIIILIISSSNNNSNTYYYYYHYYCYCYGVMIRLHVAEMSFSRPRKTGFPEAPGKARPHFLYMQYVYIYMHFDQICIHFDQICNVCNVYIYIYVYISTKYVYIHI